MRARKAVRAAVSSIEILEERRLLSGIQMAADLYAWPDFAAIGQIVPMGGRIYIQSWNKELFSSQGTQATTSLVKEFGGSGSLLTIDHLVASQSHLFMQGTTTGSLNHSLWVSDGTNGGTTDITPAALASDEGSHFTFADDLFFAGTAAGSTNVTPWASDGTSAGTVQLSSAPLVTSITPVVMQGYLFFVAGTSNAYQVYRTDGTAAGTTAIFNIPTLFANELGTTGTKLIVSLPDEIWSMDRAGGNATQISSIFDAEHLTTWQGLVYFSGCRGGLNSEGWELWRTDGTADGTYILDDIVPGSGCSFPEQLVPAQTRLYFLANTLDEGTEWWLTDGTAEGTRMSGSFAPGTAGVNPSSAALWGAATIGDTLYFPDSWQNYGPELCQTDGTQAGTGMVENLRGIGSEEWIGSWPQVITAVGPTLYFQASDNTVSNELFKYSPNDKAMISGAVFADANHNSTRDAGEVGMAGVVVYDDANNNGVLDPGETSAVTDASGNYSLNVPAGQAYVRTVLPAGMGQSLPLNGVPLSINLSSGQMLSGASFGLYVNTAPTVALPASFNVNEGQTCSLWATGTDVESGIAVYQWDLNYDGTFDVTSTSDAPTFDATSIDGPATRQIAVRVMDYAGAYSDIATTTVNILNVAPTGTFSAPSAILVGSGASVSFTNVTDPAPADAAALTYSYDFNNDGINEITNSTSATVAIPAAYLSTPGDVVVRGTISDDDGGSTSYTKTINVRDIQLSATSVDDHVTFNTVVGTLSVPGSSLSETYQLVSGVGADDNASFLIYRNSLKILVTPAQSSFHIRICATDSLGSFEKAFTITVTHTDQAPTDIALSNSTVAEDQPAGTVVGTFATTDPDAGDTATYSLVAGTGSDDNASFTINGNQLETATAFDYQTQNSYTVRIRTTDSGGLFYEKAFTISVSHVNHAPTDITLANATIAENQPAGTAIGNLSASDPDAGDTHTYTLESGTGSDDNASFAISGSQLTSAAAFNFETKSSYTVRVRAMDSGGSYFEKAFTISVTDVNEAPTGISLSGNSVPENQPAGTLVGSLSAIDPDAGDTVTYTLVSGAADNASFVVDGNQLKTAAAFNYEAKSSYSIRVRATDSGGLFYEKALTINVTDVPDSLALSGASVMEYRPAGTGVGVFSHSDPDGRTFTYKLIPGALDNGLFTISGDTLQAAGGFAYLARSSYTIKIKSVDSTGVVMKKAFTINVLPDHAPTDIVLTKTTVAQHLPVGTKVGALSAVDPDAGDSFTYTLLAFGDSQFFKVANGKLKTRAVFDAATKSSYVLRVRATDLAGKSVTKKFTITVTA